MTDTPQPEEGFLRRWARLKARPEPATGAAPASPQEPAPPALQPVPQPAAPPGEAPERQAPTLDDVARLTPQSDYSAFVAGGVDPAVRRLALKKLFADPNFAVMDGLDIYIDDYNRASPLTDAMLASLEHAPGVLARLFGKDDAPGPGAQNDAIPGSAPAAQDAVPAPCAGAPPATAGGAIDPGPDAAVVPLAHAGMPPGPGPSPQGNA